jgi:hypothetical protein
MAKKQTPNDLFWDMKKKEQIREQYNSYLKDEKIETGPHSAHLFALRKIGGGYDYMGFKERDLILLLAGELPEMYD